MHKFGIFAIILAMMAAPATAAECGAGGQGAISMLYDTGKTALTKEHKARLVKFIDIAKTKDAVCVFAQVDAQGSKDANRRVAEARAQNVKTYLASQGVPADRILIAKESESFTLFGLFDSDQPGERKVTVSYQN